MTSKEPNLTKPETLEIDLRNIENLGYRAYPCSMAEYVMMSRHDEKTLYLIMDKDGRAFMGDIEITNVYRAGHYVLGYDAETKQYILFQNIRSNWHDHLVEICCFESADAGIKALDTYNKGLGVDKLKQDIFMAINTYVRGLANLHQTIIQLISAAGFQDDPRLQEVILFCHINGSDHTNKDIPDRVRASLHNLARSRPETLYPMYSNLYDVFVKYDRLRIDHIDPEETIDPHKYKDIIEDLFRILG